MKIPLVLLIICAPLSVSSCRTEARDMEQVISSMQLASKTMDDIFLERLGFKEIECPQYLKPLVLKNPDSTKQRCIVSMEEPESLLKTLSEELSKVGKVKMQWRFDIGQWVTSYKLSGEKFDLIVSLSSPDSSEYTREDPTIKNFGSVGTFALTQEKTLAQVGGS